MCSVKITLTEAGGNQQTFERHVEKGGDNSVVSELSALRTHIKDLQRDLNEALTVLVDRDKAVNGKLQKSEQPGDQEEEEEDNDETDANAYPPEKIRKTS